MHFKNILFYALSFAFLASASVLTERQSCTSIFEPCDAGTTCCPGLSCTDGVPLGNCMPTPGVCGTAGEQCSTAIGNTCCSGLTCSGQVGTCE